nr:Hypothetical protein [Oryza sativa Japonica Group]
MAERDRKTRPGVAEGDRRDRRGSTMDGAPDARGERGSAVAGRPLTEGQSRRAWRGTADVEGRDDEVVDGEHEGCDCGVPGGWGQRQLGRARASATFKQGEAAGLLLGAAAMDSSRRQADGADQVGGGVKEAGGIGGFVGLVALGDGSLSRN